MRSIYNSVHYSYHLSTVKQKAPVPSLCQEKAVPFAFRWCEIAMGEYFDHHRGLSLTLCNAIVEQLSSIVHVSRTVRTARTDVL